MLANGPDEEKGIGQGLRLPREGEQNITELTAIARIKPGIYPKDRYRAEIRANILKKIKDELPVPLPPSVLNLVETFLDKLIKIYMENPELPKEAGVLIKELKNNPRLPSAISAIFEEFIQIIIEVFLWAPPREITWLDHLKIMLDWAHKERQSAIRKMVTIHYARWVILDQDRMDGIDGPHILFTSNFDGPLEGYLSDFAAVDEGPLNLVFGHCIGWPGARPTDGFIKYVREHQLKANVFYANYPKATVSEVNRALEWKSKTDNFIAQVQTMKGKPREEWERITSGFLNDLAKPTPRDLEFPKD